MQTTTSTNVETERVGQLGTTDFRVFFKVDAIAIAVPRSIISHSFTVKRAEDFSMA